VSNWPYAFVSPPVFIPPVWPDYPELVAEVIRDARRPKRHPVHTHKFSLPLPTYDPDGNPLRSPVEPSLTVYAVTPTAFDREGYEAALRVASRPLRDSIGYRTHCGTKNAGSRSNGAFSHFSS
jgi:hypothetical protein